MLRSVIALLSAATVLVVRSPSATHVRQADTASSEEVSQIRIPTQSGRPKIVYSFNTDDDLPAIRRAGFTHVLVSYLQNMPDAEQRRRLDAFQRAGLKVIYRIVDLVDRARRTGNDSLVQHTVLLLRDHPALAGWQTFEETNQPPAVQIDFYRKIKSWDPRHPVITIITNEYTPGSYRRTYSDAAQDVLMIDYYPYKRGYDGWPYIRQAMRDLREVQQRPVPIIPIIQASSSTHVASAEDTHWPPAGGLEKQMNLWWDLGADAGVAFWIWRGSKEYPFVGVADQDAPPWALSETTALLHRIDDGELPATESRAVLVPAVRARPPRVNLLKNSGFEAGMDGWVGYNERAALTDQAYAGRQAARIANSGTPKPIGVGQRVDVTVPPNGSVTFSAYYRVIREATLLQWMIDTTAYPRFGAASFLESKPRLPTGDWRRTSISITNGTGVPQRLKGVSILSNGFTGDILLDNLQLELSPEPTPYLDRDQVLTHPLRLEASSALGRPPKVTASSTWTLTGWSVVEVPPEAGSYACLASVERGPSHGQTSHEGRPLDLRLRVDTARSDPNGWVGVLELADGESVRCRLPLALAPGQPLFWALSRSPEGAVTLRAACAGYRLAAAAARADAGAAVIRSVSAGTDAAGAHALNGRASRVQFYPRSLSPETLQHLSAAGKRQP